MRKTLLYLCFSLSLIACQDKLLENSQVNTPTTDNSQVSIENNIFNIKLTKNILQDIDNTKNELTIPTGSSALDSYLKSINVNKTVRIFPYAGKHEVSHVTKGLNKWYAIIVDENKKQITRALNASTNTNIIEYIEAMPLPQLDNYHVEKITPIKTRVIQDAPFNDPQWSSQWDLHNTGNIGNYINDKGEQIISSVKGCDINIVPAWKVTQGTPNVVVAVVDGGIDTNHEDLKESLWVNEGEIPNNGIDDDNNGYIDDVNGYNFVDNTGEIIPQDHGTHVAGTIGARNNNGKGICGIAGGNGQTNSGVRLMSCQIFKPNPNYNPKDPKSRQTLGAKDYMSIAAAIIYGADNGAVISQNSWGFDENISEPQVIHEAIDYFIEHAGSKANAPMKGGVVFFAAGNEDTSSLSYPAANTNVIAVSSHTPNFKAAWYTNYGSWVDICAPGGSQPLKELYPLEHFSPTSEILSTLPIENGKSQYGYLQGTSMACPHISGIAALVVSKFGGEDLTNERLKRMILSGVKPIDINRFNADKYTDNLGSGIADAMLTLQPLNENTNPSIPRFISEETESSYTSIKIGLTSSPITEGSLFQYILYYSKTPITTDNYKNANVQALTIPANYITKEEPLIRVLNNLSLNTSYYFAVKTIARNGKESNLVIHNGSIQTKYNEAPKIEANIDLSTPIEMAGNDVKEVIFTLSDKENQKLTIDPLKLYYVETKEKENKVSLTLYGNRIPLGEHEIKFVVKDEIGASSIAKIRINKVADKAPQLRNNYTTIYIAKNEEKVFNLTDLVEDEAPEKLDFTLLSIQNSNIKSILKDKKLILNGDQLGESSLKIKVTDIHKQTNIITIPVFIFLNKGIYSLFPTLADNFIYIKLGNTIAGSFQIEIRDLAGKLVQKEAYNTNNIDPITRVISINTKKYLSGQYQLTLFNHNNHYTEYFIKR